MTESDESFYLALLYSPLPAPLCAMHGPWGLHPGSHRGYLPAAGTHFTFAVLVALMYNALSFDDLK